MLPPTNNSFTIDCDGRPIADGCVRINNVDVPMAAAAPDLTIAEQVEYAAHIASCLSEWDMLLTGLTLERTAKAYLYGCRHTSPGDDEGLCVAILRYAEGYGGELYSTKPDTMGHRYTVAELEAE